MMRQTTRIAIDGVLLLDKPVGITSHSAVQRVKCLLQASKAGHAGTLDPLASGLLPICLGEATKFSAAALNADKGYDAEILLGTTTSTGDLEGEVLARSPVTASRDDIAAVLRRFVGAQAQTPPMYSALKHEGRPLYVHARAGRHIEVKPRRITIHSINFYDFAAGRLKMGVTCSKGTYIRVLAEDIGRALGCGGTLSALRRVAAGPFRIEQAVTLDEFKAMSAPRRAEILLAIDSLAAPLPELVLEADTARRTLNGQGSRVQAAASTGLFRLYDPEHRFLGLGELDADGCLAPKRLVARQACKAVASP